MNERKPRSPEHLAGRISDGDAIDWSEIDATSGDEALLSEFAILERIAAVNRDRRGSLPRRRLGDYLLVELLGRGGMGEVYLAYHEKLQQPVAIKMLSHETAQSSADLLREARTLAKLQHSNIGVIHNYVQQDGLDYLVMEYIEGKTLREWMDEGPLPEKQIVELAIQLADALAAAHDQGIVHRDLKPTNLMIRDGVLKVLDFGLAKLVEAVDEATIDVTAPLEKSVLAGTIPYMAPEQIDRLPLDGRADLFSVGIILYELATGRRPFEGPTAAAVLSAILGDNFVRPRAVNPRISRGLERVIVQLLQKRPSDRIAGARSLKHELDLLRKEPKLRKIHVLTVASVLVAAGWMFGQWYTGGSPSLVPAYESSIAVLPFVDTGGVETDEDLLAAGVTDGLVDLFGQFSGLKVIAPSSVKLAAQRDPSPVSVAGAVDARSVLTGETRNLGEKIDLDMLLLDGASGDTLWVGNFEEPLEHVQRLYANVALQVADELGLPMTPEERARLMSARTVDPEVYRTCLRARRALVQYSPEGFNEAWSLYRAAADDDPTYAPAYAGMASVAALACVYTVWTHEDSRRRANGAVAKAMELDPMQPEGYLATALIRMFVELDRPGAEEAFVRCLRLSPNNTVALMWFSNLLLTQGRDEEALELKHRLVDVDPLTASTSNSLGWTLYYAGKHRESIDQLLRTIEMDANYWHPHMILSWNYSKLQRCDEAKQEIDRMIELMADDELTRNSLAYANVAFVSARCGDRARARQIAEDLESARSERWVDPFLIAWTYDAAGDPERALPWLRTSLDENSPSLWGIGLSADFSPEFRNTPEYQARLAKVRR